MVEEHVCAPERGTEHISEGLNRRGRAAGKEEGGGEAAWDGIARTEHEGREGRPLPRGLREAPDPDAALMAAVVQRHDREAEDHADAGEEQHHAPADAVDPDGHHLPGFGPTVGSETEAPNLIVNLV